MAPVADGIRCMVMRGGTSKGLYFLADDLPVIPLWTQPVQYGFSEKIAGGEVLANRRLDLTTVRLNP